MWTKISQSKVFYMVLAIVCAVLCWLYVDMVEAPDIEETHYNIPVTFIGEEMLAEEDLMITSGKNTTVTLTLTGARTYVTKVDREDIRIFVQAASQITGEGTYSLEYDVDLGSAVSGANIDISKSISHIDVTVVQTITKTIDIRGEFTGSAVENAIVDEDYFEFEIPSVTITGERSVIEQVSDAVVTLDEKNLSATWTGSLPIQFRDGEGNLLDSQALSPSISEVYARFPVRLYKEVPLTVSFKAGGGATEANVSNRLINPAMVTITGTEELLSKIESIELGTVDLSKIITSDVITFTIPTPEGVSVISGSDTATVSVSVAGLVTRTVHTNNIQFINLPEGIDLSAVTKSLSVRIRGSETSMALVLDSDVIVTVDFANIDLTVTGTRNLPATVSVVGFSDVGAVGEYQVVAVISNN